MWDKNVQVGPPQLEANQTNRFSMKGHGSDIVAASGGVAVITALVGAVTSSLPILAVSAGLMGGAAWVAGHAAKRHWF